MKRRALICAGFFLLTSASYLSAYAQTATDWPTKPVKIVSGLAAGSSMDLVARLLAPKLSELWGQPVVIETRTGAAGNIAAGAVANADDNHTLLIAQNAITVSASLYPKLSYKLKTDLKPVSQLTSMPHVVVTNAKSPAKTLRDLIEMAKLRPNQLNFSSAGIGNADHMAAELMNAKADISMINIPYPGGAQAINAVLAGDVQMYFPGLPSSLPQIKAGNLRALAVTSSTRSPALPDVPTVSEAGIPGFSTVLWYGVFAPSSMAEATVKRISADLQKTLKSPDMQAKLGNAGIDPVGSSSDAFKVFVNSEIDRWEQIVRSRNLRPE